MRSSLLAGLGAVVVLVGGLWAGQGVGLFGGSPMTGETRWTVIGVVVLLAGLALLGYGTRPRRRPDPPPEL